MTKVFISDRFRWPFNSQFSFGYYIIRWFHSSDTFISFTRTGIYARVSVVGSFVPFHNSSMSSHIIYVISRSGICSFRIWMALQSSSPLQTINANILNHLLLPCILLFLIIYSRWQRLG